MALWTGCSSSGEAVPTPSTAAGTGRATVADAGTSSSAPSATRPFQTLPPVGSYRYPTAPNAVVVQISSRVPAGPAVPLLTVYGDGLVIAGTTAGWFQGSIADGDIQLFLDEAESVGLLDDELTLRGPDAGADPDLTVLLDVDGTRRVHEFDLSRIERPVALRAFLQDASVYNRFALSDPVDAGAWVACDDTGGCEVAPTPSSPSDRPVLPHEDVGDLLTGP